MSTMKRITIVSMAILVGSASSALAGTKSQANLVPATLTNPTMSSKGKLKLDDKGSVQAVVKGVTDGAGAPVTTSTSYKTSGTLDGTEYIVILKGTFTALSVPFESAIPVGLKNGNGVSKLSLSTLFSLIPPAVVRSIEVTGGEVWGPLGTGTLAACQLIVDTGFDLVPGNTACRQGTQIGVAGINIP